MKKRNIILFALSIIFFAHSVNSTYANFNHAVDSAVNQIAIGSWRVNIIDEAPEGTIDLNELIVDNNINQTLPSNSYFIYNNQLFIVGYSGYNPIWHGLPYTGNNVEGWAFINLSLDWAGATQRYTTGAVVRVGERFFQAMHAGNTCDPTTNYGPTTPINSGKPWREIEPMEDYMFNMIPNSSLVDYSSPILQYVIEKN